MDSLDRVEDIKKRLGLQALSEDEASLRNFFRAWCSNVPFDNLRKSQSMCSDPEAPLLPIDANEFFHNFLEHGTGGTCWQHSDAIYSLAKALGFDARRGAGSMFDMDDLNHGTVLVRLPNDSMWILDNAFLTGEPLRINKEAPSLLSERDNYAEVEIDGDELFVHGTHPPMPWIFFRLRERNLTREDYVRQWTMLGTSGPFNAGLHIRKNLTSGVTTLRGSTLFHLRNGFLEQENLDPSAIQHHLVSTFGISPEFVDSWSRSGALELSLKPPGAPPELPKRVPPSKR
jgi:arylamine N-acetyltransferase